MVYIILAQEVLMWDVCDIRAFHDLNGKLQSSENDS